MANREGIFYGFQSGSGSLPFVVTEIGRPRSGGDNQIVVRNGSLAQAGANGPCATIDRLDATSTTLVLLRLRRIRRIGIAISAGDNAAVAT